MRARILAITEPGTEFPEVFFPRQSTGVLFACKR
jgi:hypothetical protein